MDDNFIVGLGEILWDIFPDRKILGGAPANFACHMSQFGYNAYVVSAVGNDILGKEILTHLKDKQLNCLVETTSYPTGTVQVILDDRGIPEYKIAENVAWDYISFTREMEVLAEVTQAVCFGSLAQRSVVSRSTVREFLRKMPDNSLKIFDINLRQHFYTKELTGESLHLSNVLKINDEEISIVSQMFGYGELTDRDACDRLQQEFDLEIIILTKGINGSFVYTRNETSFLPTPAVSVADTVGAGDSFTAAFAASLLKTGSISDAHKLAVAVSAYVCTRHGAMPDLPDEYKKLVL